MWEPQARCSGKQTPPHTIPTSAHCKLDEVERNEFCVLVLGVLLKHILSRRLDLASLMLV
jgi:hypothetical protein